MDGYLSLIFHAAELGDNFSERHATYHSTYFVPKYLFLCFCLVTKHHSAAEQSMLESEDENIQIDYTFPLASDSFLNLHTFQ